MLYQLTLSRRFDHIENVTRDALKKLQAAEHRLGFLEQVHSLDDEIASLCARVGASPGSKLPDYEKLPLETVQRLVKARQARIKHLKGAMVKKRDSQQLDQNEKDVEG
jgi:copper homeostasis protein CutC